jgi:hypothetical protein
MKNNLFNFATSELSQDAFVCWSLNCLNETDDAEAQTYARNFIFFLCGVEPLSDRPIEIIQQYYFKDEHRNHVDVIFKFDSATAQHILVMENKTHTSHHSKQLETYRNYFESKSEYQGCAKHYVYFKTGLINNHDRRAFDKGYKVIGRQDLVLFLQQQTWTNPILVEFTEYLCAWDAEWRANTKAMYAGDLNNLQHDYCQWDLLNKISTSLQSVSCDSLYNGTSLGRPWTQYCFYKMPELFPRNDTDIRRWESLFYRLDARNNASTKAWAYYLSLRHYADVSGDCQETKTVKQARAKRFKQCWQEFQSNCTTSLKFGSPSSGVSEDEIFTLFLDENTLNQVFAELPKIHLDFLTVLQNAKLLDSQAALESVNLHWLELKA